MQRRTFCTGMVALAAMPGSAAALSASVQPRSSESLFVQDQRLATSVVSRFGSQSCFVDGDVSAAWFSRLRPMLQDGSSAIFGETLGDAMFCIRHLASDLGWHVHARGIDGLVVEAAESNPQSTYQWTLKRAPAPALKAT